jgi:hypothetical protein
MNYVDGLRDRHRANTTALGSRDASDPSCSSRRACRRSLTVLVLSEVSHSSSGSSGASVKRGKQVTNRNLPLPPTLDLAL